MWWSSNIWKRHHKREVPLRPGQFVFPFATEKHKDRTTQISNFVFCFILLLSLVSHIKKKLHAKDVRERLAQTVFRPKWAETIEVDGETSTGFWWGNLQETDHLEDLLHGYRGFFPGGKAAWAWRWPLHLQLAPRLRISGARAYGVHRDYYISMQSYTCRCHHI
jgi:hypothetical protein